MYKVLRKKSLDFPYHLLHGILIMRRPRAIPKLRPSALTDGKQLTVELHASDRILEGCERKSGQPVATNCVTSVKMCSGLRRDIREDNWAIK